MARLALIILIAFSAPAFADYAAYEARQKKLAELAGVLGETHHIRSLCDGEESEVWRRRMSDLMELEDPPRKQRDAMIEAFNDGFYKARRAYPECTDDARRAVATLAEDGRRLSSDLASGLSE